MARGLGVFRGVKRALGKFLGQLAQEFPRQGVLFLAASRKGQHDFGERPEIAAVLRSVGDLLHAELFVAVNSAEPKSEAETRVQRANDVIGDAGRDVRVSSIGMPGEQLLGVIIGLFHALQAVEMLFF